MAWAQQAPLPACQPSAEQVLQHLNALRASPRSCGGAPPLPAAGPLRWHERLADSSQRYAEELARRDLISHQGLQAATLRERLRQSGYRLRNAGENLAAGPGNLDEALAQWLLSPAHCDNLMAPEFEHAGLACVAAPGRYGHFWVLHLGRSLPD